MKKEFLQNMGLSEGQMEESFGTELSDSFKLAAAIAKELGGDREKLFIYLAQYLKLVFATAYEAPFAEATDQAVQSMRNMIESKGRFPDELLCVSENLPKEDVLKEDLLYVLSGGLLPMIINNYAEQLRLKAERLMDSYGIVSMYEEICELLGNRTEIDELNQKLIITFVKIPPQEFYRQGIVSDVLYTLYYIREDSDKTVIEDVIQFLSQQSDITDSR